jgi:hypothetical protein
MADATKDKQIDRLQNAFEMTCDQIQMQTERMLDLVPRHDKQRRQKILDLHRAKLQKALNDLNNQLAKFY